MSRVSVVIPTYNRRAMVREAVASALVQTLVGVEVIVVDDGSTDGTADALRAEFGDRIIVIEQTNQGESVARNRGIELATAEYVAFLDSDDWWEPEKLARQVEVLDARSEVVLVTTWYRMVDRGGRSIEPSGPPRGSEIGPASFDLESIGLENPLSSGPSTVMVRKDALLKIGGFDARIRYGEDDDLWLRLRLVGTFAIVPSLLASIRTHRASQFNTLTPETIDERLASYIAMTERFFDQWPSAPPIGLRERCLARRYAAVALMDYLIGRAEVGHDRFQHAVALDGEMGRHEVSQLERQFGWGMRQRAELEQRAGAATSAIFDAAMAHWPTALVPIPADLRRWLVTEVFGTLGWRHARCGQWREARRCLSRVARVEGGLLFNRGYWSVWVRSLVEAR